MTPASLLGLAGVTAAAVVAAVVSVQATRASDTLADKGQPLISGLISQANAIDQIGVRQGDWTVNIRKEGEAYVDAETGYPVRTDAVRDLVGSLAVLDIEERKTATPARFADLELAAPGAEEGAGRQLTLKVGNAVVADVILGLPDATVGGSRGGLFARYADKPPAYLVRGGVTMPGTRQGWFETQILKFAPQDLLQVTLKPLAGTPIELAKSKDSGALALENMPAGETADSTKVQRYSQLLSTLVFDDVRKAVGDATAQGPLLSGVTKDLMIHVQPVAAKFNSDDTWVRVQIKPQAVSTSPEANKLNAAVKGFEFKLKKFDAEPLSWQLKDVLNVNKELGQEGQAGAQQGMPPPMLQAPGNN